MGGHTIGVIHVKYWYQETYGRLPPSWLAERRG